MHYTKSRFRAHLLLGAFLIGVFGGHDHDGWPALLFADRTRIDGERPAGHCRKTDLPVTLTLSLGEGEVVVGRPATVDVVVQALDLVINVRLTLRTEGPLTVTGATDITIGTLQMGATQSLQVPVVYTSEGRSILHVDLVAGSDGNANAFRRHEALYTILEDGRLTSGTLGFLRLDLQRLEEDVENGVLTEEEARPLARELTTPPVTIDDDPRPFIPPTAEQAALARGLEPVADPEDTFVPDEQPDLGLEAPREGAGAGGTITVQGTVSWVDVNGATHPAFGMTVQVRDDELVGSELVADATTDVNGQYSFVVNNDDGFLAGNRDIFVRIRTANSAVSIESPGLLGAPYEADTAVMNEVPDGTLITQNPTAANTGTGPSCGMLTGATYVAAYTRQLNAGSFLSQIELIWPGSGSNYDGSDIDLLQDDRWDWDVMFHEYGHYVMDTFNFENSPGGMHSGVTCLSVTRMSKGIGVPLAWGEGWPTFFGTVGQQVLNLASLGVPGVGDINYDDTIDATISYSLEAQGTQAGEDNEIAVQRLLWDLVDGPADGRDTIQVTDQSLFDLFNANDPTTLSAAWSAVRVGLSNQQDLAYGAITTDHLIGPNPMSPAAGSTVGPGAVLSWMANVGCSNMFAGNNFDLVFYDAATFAELLTLPGITTTSSTLSLADYQTLRAVTKNVRWAVEGRHTGGPATGPYLGDNRTLTLNRPPVCNAGGPYQPECAVATMLNGSGSSDPDGDPLTLNWTGPFNGGTATGPMPSVTFPAVANVTVTLAVSDGLATASCMSSVMVRDTLPPMIPPDLTVECTSPAGTPVNLGVPTDLCDPTLSFSNDAPPLFGLGMTTVTWMVTDDSGNMPVDTTQVVTVEDTTPPTLSLSVSPDILWPPNHTLRNVHVSVTVSDVCDATPTVRLVSITSSEADSGTGPLDKPNDIQGAAFGTDDRFFRLRAEHSPGGSRTYTITYEATDDSGNSAPASVIVRVPKSTAELISRDGPTANGGSPSVAVNTNGTFVTFPSDATNLITGGLSLDTNDVRDVFIRNRSPRVTNVISVGALGEPAIRASHAQGLAPAISGNGRFVAFYSDADNLVAGDMNRQTDVFVRDTLTGMTERVSIATGGVEGNGPSLYPSMTDDGRYVAFQSLASNLVAGDANDVADIFLHDRDLHTTIRLCDLPEPNGASFTPSIDAAGGFVAFASAATNLVIGDTNGHIDIFVCSVATGVVDLESVNSAGELANGDSILPALSGNSNVVAYKSEADNLVPGDRNGLVDVFATDRLANTAERISVSRGGGDADAVSFPPSISDDGRFVAFGSLATNLAAGDTNNTSNVFVRDRQRGETLIVDVNDGGEIGNRGTPDVAPAITGDGVQIGFISLASNLAGSENEVLDVFIVCNPFLATPPVIAPGPLLTSGRNVGPASRIRRLGNAKGMVGRSQSRRVR